MDVVDVVVNEAEEGVEVDLVETHQRMRILVGLVMHHANQDQ